MTPYERLDAWKLAHELVLETYQISNPFPSSERFGLTRQLRRAAFSVAANIAEGSEKAEALRDNAGKVIWGLYRSMRGTSN
jgi:four helix bundle protein